MIISRRKIHLFSSIALAIIMPIIFIAGILFRPTYTTVTPDTEQLLSNSIDHTTVAQPLQLNISDQNPIAAFFKPTTTDQ